VLNPTFLAEVARLEHENRLRQAEAQRRIRQITGHRPGLLKPVANRLMAAGQKIKSLVLEGANTRLAGRRQRMKPC
jgi:hypothetical protein